MTYGIYQRTLPRVVVLRGYWGNENAALTFSAKIAANQAIKSGMLISLNSSGLWVIGCPEGNVPYIAFEDATDTDVLSSGLLLGYSCSGDFEIETAYIDAAATYNQDTPLIAGTGDKLGYLLPIRDIDDDADIIGFCTRGGKRASGTVQTQAPGYLNASGVKQETLQDNRYMVANGGTNSESVACSVVSFYTAWKPVRTVTRTTTTTTTTAA